MGKFSGPVLKLFFVVLFMSLSVHTSSNIEEKRETDHWFQRLHYSKQKLTRLHFYFHDIVSGPAQTTMVVVPPAKTGKPSHTSFGQVNMFDNPLTKGPEPTSELLGRAQGLYGFASHEDVSLLMAMTIVLTGGEHNGSSFTVLGRNAVIDSTREFPVVGGTGEFRLGRGFATAKTYFFNDTIAIVEYNVVVIHY
ncbi:PREDICTED: dirigent protein 22-like [Fragaria vesca subsp. vesca]|uniref:dirigent protein 22-like n=1 Tax=Fragaria vesca subsp. vesca TaxID=101020 RepID=UPI0002C32D7C|nr:PREDICTED: dirigent protein 22-like [Fragaria vesca subsp. vesca]